MKQQTNRRFSPKQREGMEHSENRFMLLDTIREMIDIELDHRGLKPASKPLRTLWQRLMGIFTSSLL